MSESELETTATEQRTPSRPDARSAQSAERRAAQATVSFIHLDTGGCGACAQSVAALLAPRYAGALRAEGISVARSPRHADIALVTGGMTRAARAAALRTLDATPYPHALVAVGDCAIDGCVFRGSPLLIADPAEALDANVEIAGCPPAPEAILAAIVEAKRLLTGDITEDADEQEVDDGDETNDAAAMKDASAAGDTTMAADGYTLEDESDDADEDTADEDTADDDVDDDTDDVADDVDDEEETRGSRK